MTECMETCHVDVPCPHGKHCDHLAYAEEMLTQGRISMIKIKDIEELKREAEENDCKTPDFEGCISLANGLARSGKRIRYFTDDDSWEVYHEIDETEECFNSTKQMLKQTNIGLALEQGALFQYDYSRNV